MDKEIVSSKIVKAIAGFEIANALLGLGSIMWSLINGAFFGLYFMFMPIYWSFFLYAGIQLRRNFNIGFRLSLALQAFVTPFIITSSGYITLNSPMRLPISAYVAETTMGIDLLALTIFVTLFYIGHPLHKDYTDS